MSFRVATPLLFSLGVLLSACSTETVVSEDTSDASEHALAPAMVHISEMENEILIATVVVEEDCMESKGFQVHPYRDEAEVVDFDSEWAGFWINYAVPPEKTFAGKYGYGMSIEAMDYLESQNPESFDESDTDRVTIDPEFNKLSIEEKADYFNELFGNNYGDYEYGIPVNEPLYSDDELSSMVLKIGGCSGQVASLLPRDDLFPETTVHSALMDYFEASFWDNESHIESMEDWSRCMSSNGFPDFSKPEDIEQSLKGVYDEDYSLVKKEEIDVALVDIDCSESSGITQVRLDLEQTAAKDTLEHYETELFAYQDILEEQLLTLGDMIENGLPD